MPELTPADLRLAIARARGWEEVGPGGACLVVPPEGDPRRAWAAEWDENGFPHWMPDWPGDIAAAWELVEEISEYRRYEVEFSVNAKWGTRVCVWDWDGRAGEEDVVADCCASTAPLAICRAWLAWKAGQK